MTEKDPITRDWLLRELPLRQVEKRIGAALRAIGFGPVLEAVLRKGFMASERVGVVDVDVELGRFNVHEMGGNAVYLEAVYGGEIDVDVRVKDEESYSGEGYRAKSFMLDIEVTAQIDVAAGKIVNVEIGVAEVF